MASGKQHWQLSTMITIVGTGVAFHQLPPVLAGAVTAGLIIGKYCNPDVRDQEHVQNYAEKKFRRTYGLVLGFLFWVFWWPLAKLIPHRNCLSHFPPIATPLAFLYLFVPLLAFWWRLSEPSVGLEQWLWDWLYNWIAVGVLAGWMVQDFGHLAQDGFKFYWWGGR